MDSIVSDPATDSLTSADPARDAALNWLMGRINYERTSHIPYQERQLKLDRMRQLLTRLGQPDAALKIVHVAGTKGKGSTSAMIAAMLTAAGYRTGVFSSPHLECIEERFGVDGLPATSAEFVALVNRLRPIVRGMDEEAAAEGDPAGGPTYFDITTAMALLHFAERQVDAAVLEVGLGGRLDSTNVCLPALCVITSISFDHMRQLGNTLAAIAREKAGIIKPGVPVVCGVWDSEPQAVIAQTAREHGCRLLQLGRDFEYSYTPPSAAGQGDKETRRNDSPRVPLSPCPLAPLSSSSHGLIDFQHSLLGQELQLERVELAMHGAHQAANAAVSLAAIAELRHQGWCISTDAMRLGLSHVRLPGRVEIIGRDPLVILDTAHNEASARALVEALAELPSSSRRTLLLSLSRDKEVRSIVRVLAPAFDRFFITEYQENPRVVPAADLAAIVRESLPANSQPFPSGKGQNSKLSPSENVPVDDRGADVQVFPAPPDAWKSVLQTAIPGERLCVAGSFYLAAEMRPLILSSIASNAEAS